MFLIDYDNTIEFNSPQENTQALVDGLFAQDQQKRLTSINKVHRMIRVTMEMSSMSVLLLVFATLSVAQLLPVFCMPEQKWSGS